MITRRRLLRGAGATLALGAGVAGWRAWDQGMVGRGPGPAYGPWTDWQGRPGEGLLPLVRAAILAPSPHNTQAWRFRLGTDVVEVLADHARHLGTIDPARREMHIGLGCAIENLVLAAGAAGLEAAVEPATAPGPDDPVARVTLARGGGGASRLHAAIPLRHTNRGPYDGRPVEDTVLAALTGLGVELGDVAVAWYVDGEARARLAALVLEATEAIVADEAQAVDSARWIRHSWREIQRHRDGLTIDAQSLPLTTTVMGKLLPALPRPVMDRTWLAATRDVHLPTAGALGIVLVRDTADVPQRLAGGRLWQRMHLWAADHGLAMHPLSQVVERADREASLGAPPRFGATVADLVARPGWQALMPFRIGRPLRPAGPSPRRPVDAVVVARA